MTDAQVPNFPQDERIQNATGISDVQSIKLQAKKGKWTVKYEGVESAELQFNLTAAELKTALEGLDPSLVNNITVTGGVGDEGGTKPYVVTFVNALANKAVPLIKVTSKSLEEGTVNGVVLTHVTVGAPEAAGVKGTGLADRTGEANPLESESPAEKRTNHNTEFD